MSISQLWSRLFRSGLAGLAGLTASAAHADIAPPGRVPGVPDPLLFLGIAVVMVAVGVVLYRRRRR